MDVDLEKGLYISVLAFQDNNVWVAHALEMDLVGTGNSPEEAIQTLQECVLAQVEFAMEQDDPSLIFFDPDPELWSIFQNARKAMMTEKLSQVLNRHRDKEDGGGYRIFSIPFPPEPLMATA